MRNPMLAIGGGFLALVLLFAIIGPIIRTNQLKPADQPNFTAVYSNFGKVYAPPGSPNLPLGSDELGRDEIARLAQGARVSLEVGFIVQVLAVSVGMLMGMLGTFSPSWIRLPLLRFTDAMFAFPDILLAILIVGTFGHLALGIL